jgi:transposase InsO family protein
MAWRIAKVKQQRIEFVVAVNRKQSSLSRLCQEFGISRPTGYRWWRRYQQAGVAGIEERSRRPQHSPGRTAAELEQRVVELRWQRPDWGARKIQCLLERENVRLPAGTIHRILLRHDLVREADRHEPAVQRFERAAPNELWQMDFKGPKGWDAAVGPLSVLDDHSRYAVALQATGDTREESVRDTLTATFQACGVPEAMLMDHGCPWWNGQGERGWTRLTVWLMKQDIGLHFGRYRHPQTQGKVERLHRSLTAALLRRGKPVVERRQVWLDEFRYEYNWVRPHQALGMKTPSRLWRESARRYQPSPAPWAYPAGWETVEVTRYGQIRVEGRYYWVSGALGGEQVGVIEAEGRLLIYFRRTLVQELDLEAGGASRERV